MFSVIVLSLTVKCRNLVGPVLRWFRIRQSEIRCFSVATSTQCYLATSSHLSSYQYTVTNNQYTVTYLPVHSNLATSTHFYSNQYTVTQQLVHSYLATSTQLSTNNTQLSSYQYIITYSNQYTVTQQSSNKYTFSQQPVHSVTQQPVHTTQCYLATNTQLPSNQYTVTQQPVQSTQLPVHNNLATS